MLRSYISYIWIMIFAGIVSCRGNRINNDINSRPIVITESSPGSVEDTGPVISGTDKYSVIFDSLTAHLPGYFTIIIEKPFIVIGDENRTNVAKRAESTVRWAVSKLKQSYFKTDPKTTINIWLFKDDSSYYFHANKLFNEQPPSKFGYYSPQHKSLIINIGTGGGTLVHEIVHPYIDANFPDCPPWFNEGLASLYEQCGEKEGSIHGYTNWRLAGLKEAINDNKIPLFKELMAMNAFEFYGENSATHYGQARYLCYYLQENNKLVEYYHAFVKNYTRDSSGYITLQAVLGENDMSDFQNRWQDYVMQLHFP